jgi:beta-glucanase (GH16 family)
MKMALLLFFFFLCCLFSVAQTFSPGDSSWKVRLYDEFNDVFPTTIDTSQWSTSFPWGQNNTPEMCNCDSLGCDTLTGVNYFEQWDDIGLANHSLAIDTAGNGSLKITAYKQNYYAPITNFYPCGDIRCTDTACYFNGDSSFYYCVSHDSALFNYTTAMLYSKRKFKYGYFELKFRIPPAPTPPATDSGYTIDWWLWAGDGNHHSNEIDMYEIRGRDSMYTNNVHFYAPPVDTVDQGSTPYFNGSINSSWHVSALEWAPDKIDFFLDGVKIRSYPVKPDSMIPMPMIIDLDANATNFCNGVDTAHTVFPYQIQVDYIKVYQLKMACDEARNICVYTPATYDSVYKSLTFAGGGCTTTIPDSGNLAFRATDFIQLDSGFTANHTDMLLEIVPCETDQHAERIGDSHITQPPPASFLRRKLYNY